MTTNNLLDEFPPISTELWEEVIRKDLKGADYAKQLVWNTGEGLAAKPYYRAEDIRGLEYLDAAPGDFPFVRGTNLTGEWRIREGICSIDLEGANGAARSAVASGAEEIAFFNAPIDTPSDLGMLLFGLDEIPVHFENAGESLIRLLMERLTEQPRSGHFSTGFDPLSNLDFAATVVENAPHAPIPFTIQCEEFEESGATAVQEVGFAIAAGIDFLAEIESRAVDIDRASASVSFSFAIGANFFFQIAKLRAFRMLWARAVESFGGSRRKAKARIHARTSRWNKTIYDPHVNILRGTTEAMSAILGGANSITVAPFDECYRTPDDASRRLARNTEILLKQEAMLSRVSDPGGGSYCLEAITSFIAQEGWKTMQGIEAAGGYKAARADGQIARSLEQSLAARDKAVVSRRRVFTGTNQYINNSETALDRIDVSHPHTPRRATESYEQLRLRTERHAATSGRSPLILLAEFGSVKMRSARSNFAANFFGCAGFNIVTAQFDRAVQVASTDAQMIVLCSSDAEYLALATELMGLLKAHGRETPVLVAGNPETTEQLRASGVEDFIHIRSNPIEVLTKWQQHLGIKG